MYTWNEDFNYFKLYIIAVIVICYITKYDRK
nr:MAG TPA: hypothetical protein [Caudoviricetes sp.]